MKAAWATVFDNAKFNGSGIEKVEKESTGCYLVYYTDYFVGSPGVSATSWGVAELVSLNIDAENCCEVRVTDLQGNLKDGGFFFLAVGN
jgi:hypothetical protein